MEQCKTCGHKGAMAQQLLAQVAPHVAMRNPAGAVLVEKALAQGAKLSDRGALCVWTGKRTGRSPNDKFVVRRPESEKNIWWGKVNQPLEPEKAEKIASMVVQYLAGRELYQVDAWVGADPRFGRPVTVVTDSASHAFFSQLIFRKPPEIPPTRINLPITIFAAPHFTIDPKLSGLNSEAGIILDLDEGLVIIYGSAYAGEIKKSVFTAMNYYMPLEGVFPMHCSANVGDADDVALFFGLSGTGKTSLSADSTRRLIGDDEHGWSDTGVFNFEGGCYAKCIKLSKEREPEIWNALRFGSLLENVVIDEHTRLPDFDSDAITENTRATYPLAHNPLMLDSGVAGHPKTILFLVADAFGIMPPIAKLTKEQAMYYFISGYTAKLAGTEVGMTQPEATFSSCFGEPFLPLHPQKYADMLRDKISQHDTRCFLVNTGWSGGPYGVGKRIDIRHTKAMVAAAIRGDFDGVETWTDPVFGLVVPLRCKGVPEEILVPRNTWADKEAYDQRRIELAKRFAANIAKYPGVSREVLEAGPKV